MRPENQRMQAFLKANGIEAMPKYIKDGSCKHSWRLYGVTGERDANGRPVYQRWWDNQPLIDKMNALGFVSLFNEKLDKIHGNGGMFSVLVRGHFELLQDIPAPKKDNIIPYTSLQTRRDIRAQRAARANDRITKRDGSLMYY